MNDLDPSGPDPDAITHHILATFPETDYAALDRVLPHPVYAKQLYISILNPSAATWRDVVVPLLAEAHDRLAARRARAAAGRSARD